MGNEDENHPAALAVRWLLAWCGGRRALLAARSGISVSSIRRYERGKTRPRRTELEALAEAAALPVPLDEFLSWCQRMARTRQAPVAEVCGERPRASLLDTATERLVQAVVSRVLLPGRPSAAGG